MRTLEPIPLEAWSEIKEEALTVLKSALSARKVVDTEGPKGLDHPAVPTGRLNIAEGGKNDQVSYGIHSVMPLLELKIPFTLNITEDSFLISERGGDFIFTLGQDVSLGYEFQDHENLRLFLLESFSFIGILYIFD